MLQPPPPPPLDVDGVEEAGAAEEGEAPEAASDAQKTGPPMPGAKSGLNKRCADYRDRRKTDRKSEQMKKMAWCMAQVHFAYAVSPTFATLAFCMRWCMPVFMCRCECACHNPIRPDAHTRTSGLRAKHGVYARLQMGDANDARLMLHQCGPAMVRR